jgi:glycosyltransferase involved in cell wall biosynthesis
VREASGNLAALQTGVVVIAETSRQPTRPVLLLVGSLRSGGTEGQVAMLANQLVSRGRGVTVGVLGASPVHQRLDRRVNIEQFGTGGVAGFLAARRKVRAMASRYACVLGFLDAANVVAAAAAPATRVVFNVRSAGISPGWVASVAFRIAAQCAGRAERIVANSGVVRDFYRDHGYHDAPFTVIANAVDGCRFQPDSPARARLREHLGLAPKTPLVGFFARWQPEKRFDVFIEAFACPELADAHAVLAGRGVTPENSEVRALMEGYPQLADRVHLLGERSDVEALVPAVDVVANTSDFEGFSNGLLEAMACGVPCIATSIGANVEALDEAGNYVDVGDPEALGRALASLLADPDECLYLSHAGRRRALERFSIRPWVDAFLGVIDAADGGS